MEGFGAWPIPRCSPRSGSARPCCATASSRPSHQTSLVHDHLPTDDLVAYHEARARGGVGADLHRGDRDPRDRPPDRAHDRRLPARHRRRLPAPRRRASARTARGCSCSSSTAGASRSPTPPLPPAVGAVGRAVARASTSSRARSRGARSTTCVAGFADVRRGGARGRRRRHRGVDGARLPRARSSSRRGRTCATTTTTATSSARLRFAREVLAAVREAAGDGVAVGVRLAADEVTPDGLGPDACAEIARGALRATATVDFVVRRARLLGDLSRLDRASCRRRPSRATRSPSRSAPCAPRSPACR